MEWAALLYSVLLTLTQPWAQNNNAETPYKLASSPFRRLLQDSSCDDAAGAVELNEIETTFAGLIVLGAVGLCAAFKLDVTGALLLSAVRAALQLVLLGYILMPVFEHQELWMVALVLFAMNTIGAREIYAGTSRYYPRLFLDCWISIFIGGFVPIALALALVIKVDPWYNAQYIIPMMGMILGNVLKGVQLALDSATQAFTEQRSKVELYLARGATKWEAARPVYVTAARCGMTPTINTMSIMGLVSIPGMMTGQILGGTDPLLAARYQIVIIFLIAAASIVGLLVALYLLQTIVFDDCSRLTVDRLIKRKEKSGDIVVSFFKFWYAQIKKCRGACYNFCQHKKTKNHLEYRLLNPDIEVNLQDSEIINVQDSKATELTSQTNQNQNK